MELSAENLRRGLNTRFIGQHIIYYQSLPSTMDVAREKGWGGAAEGTLVIAENQTAGRGRLHRSWVSPGGGITLSLILRPTITQLPQMIMIASLGVVNAIGKVTGVQADIKWPNDVLIKGKKVCGILIENQLRGGTVEFSVIGIGLNVNMDVSVYAEIADIATSLSVELGREVSRIEVLQALLAEMERLYLLVKDGQSLHHLWRKRLITLGQEVQVAGGETLDVGVAEDVDPDGSLLLRHPDGSLLRIVAGDVTLRPLPQK